MKTHSRFAVVLSLILLIAGKGAAQDNTRGPSARQLETFLKQNPGSDANKDGKLTPEEARDFRRKQRSTQPDASRRADSQRLAPTHANVAYGDDPQQVFDIWLAKSKDGAPAPLCMFIHGGGFRGGSKNVSGAVVQQCLDAGISFASLNYRLTQSGKNPYPIPMMDCARALQFIRSKAGEWNLDAKRVASYGGSAGAGISLWLAFHDDMAKPDASDPIARQSTRLVAAATTNGQSTYDMRTFSEWFGVPDLKPHPALTDLYAVKTDADWKSERVLRLMHDASPISHLTADDVPVFMVYGKGDVPVDASTNESTWVHHIRLGHKLKEAMTKLGLECTVTQDGGDGAVREFLIGKLRAAK
ncbi:MAG: alpha/beta hydrolase [Chthoniobacteraceae bacterium]